jgi:5-methylcytosine-specific restriction enzyme subunit McrC
MPSRRISVFDQGQLRVGHDGFLERDVEAIARYEERNHTRAFEIGWKRVRVLNHVGVFASGDLVIEILPKAERSGTVQTPELRRRWADLLLDMLSVVYDLPLRVAGSAGQGTKKHSLLDVFVRHFLILAEEIAVRGLAKGYRRVQERVAGVKGKCVADGATLESIVHRESLLCEFDLYDWNTLHNGLISSALRAIRHLPVGRDIIHHAARLAEIYPEVGSQPTNEAVFNALTFDRRTDHYRKALDIARLILLGYAPAERAGEIDTLALLFDMSALFEAFVGIMVRRAARAKGWSVRLQASTRFWGSRTVRPDIVVGTPSGCFVLDTKWKVLKSPAPSDADLRQMYVYNKYFHSATALLVYPEVYEVPGQIFPFRRPDDVLSCGVAFVPLFHQGKLSRTIGVRLVDIISGLVARAAETA